MMKKRFTPLETIGQKTMVWLPIAKAIGRRQKATVSLTGFTLVEVLVSLSILSVGMIMVFQLFLSSLQSISYSNKLNEISRFAEKKLEELKTEKGQMQTGGISGKENDLDWKIIGHPLRLTPDLEVIFVELDINFNFQGNPQTQKFVTYIYEN